MQPDMQNFYQQLMQMQNELMKAQSELKNTVIEGSSGGGAVVVKCNGAMEFKSVKIKKEAVDPEDVETLEDLVLMAIQDAMNKCEQIAQQKVGPAMGGMPPGMLPPGMGL